MYLVKGTYNLLDTPFSYSEGILEGDIYIHTYNTYITYMHACIRIE